MKKFIGLVLFMSVTGTMFLTAQERIKHYRRAPDVLPGTLPEMRTPGFWIDRAEDPDEVILLVDEILQMNEAYCDRMADLSTLDHNLGSAIDQQLKSWTGLFAVRPDLAALSKEERVVAIQEKVKAQIQKMRKSPYGNVLGIQYADWELYDFEKEMAYDRIQGTEGIRYGMTVRTCRLRIVPNLRPEHVAVGDNGRARWDMFNLDVVPIATPLEVLHVSESGTSLLVSSHRGYGWIRSEDVAFGSMAEADSYLAAKSFIICTGEQVPFYTDASCKVASGLLRMGDRLIMSETGSTLTVQVPFRNPDGSLSLEKAWLKEDADVSKGYLAYTRRNIINQAFKLLDLVYDYTGGWLGRNHVTILRDLYACFGFDLPGNGVLLQAFSYSGSIQPEIGKEKQYGAMLQKEPFVTIMVTRGHSQLYLGTYEGTPYVFDTHGYKYTGDDEKEYVIRRSCVYTPELPAYMLKHELVFINLGQE